jgi:hypothetical protein
MAALRELETLDAVWTALSQTLAWARFAHVPGSPPYALACRVHRAAHAAYAEVSGQPAPPCLLTEHDVLVRHYGCMCVLLGN